MSAYSARLVLAVALLLASGSLAACALAGLRIELAEPRGTTLRKRLIAMHVGAISWAFAGLVAVAAHRIGAGAPEVRVPMLLGDCAVLGVYAAYARSYRDRQTGGATT